MLIHFLQLEQDPSSKPYVGHLPLSSPQDDRSRGHTQVFGQLYAVYPTRIWGFGFWNLCCRLGFDSVPNLLRLFDQNFKQLVNSIRNLAGGSSGIVTWLHWATLARRRMPSTDGAPARSHRRHQFEQSRLVPHLTSGLSFPRPRFVIRDSSLPRLPLPAPLASLRFRASRASLRPPTAGIPPASWRGTEISWQTKRLI